MRIILGNESNISQEMERLPGILTSLLNNNGQEVAGRLDMSSYSDDDPDNDKAIFTPQELLQEEQPAQTDEAGETEQTGQAENVEEVGDSE